MRTFHREEKLTDKHLPPSKLHKVTLIELSHLNNLQAAKSGFKLLS
jgi:hypothetical protein